MLPISFLSDYGHADEWVGICHGVIQRTAPGAIVVDPEVSTSRLPVALRCGDGNLMVGPDNGLLWPAALACGGVAAAWDIQDSPHRLSPVSATFHGRDLFAPVAAALAREEGPDPPGRPLDPSQLMRLELPAPVIDRGGVTATVVAVDRFGNLQLELGPDGLAAAGIEPGHSLLARVGADEGTGPGDQRQQVLCGRTFADAGEGELVVYEDSSGLVALALNRGSAAAALGAARGSAIRLEPWNP